VSEASRQVEGVGIESVVCEKSALPLLPRCNLIKKINFDENVKNDFFDFPKRHHLWDLF
jgi:hypothetical protein